MEGGESKLRIGVREDRYTRDVGVKRGEVTGTFDNAFERCSDGG